MRSGSGLALAAVLALSACAAPQRLRDFKSDACSLFPEGDAEQPLRWCDCCLLHDQAYWQGGNAEQRLRADADLRACVLARTGRPWFSRLMYAGVRLGGTPLLPSGFRWGYGWPYGRGYQSLSAAEQRQADENRAAHPADCCRQKTAEAELH